MLRHPIVRCAPLWTLALLASGISTSPTYGQQGVSNGQWPSYGGDTGSTKYAALDQIDRDNFGDLSIAWKWDSIDADVLAMDGVRVRPQAFEATPLMIDGVLYTSTSFSQVAAIDAATGETLWQYDPESWKAGRPANIGFIHRGVSYWTDGEGDERIIIATGHSRLIALDAKTGEPIRKFGRRGQVNLLRGLNRPARVSVHQVNSPPVICGDVIVTGCVIADRPMTQAYLRGDIRGFDVRTGEKLWQFHSVPQEGEFGIETWENGSWKYTGNTNAWSLLSADQELGYVYVPFGAPTNDFYGGHRLGDNLFANCVVCLDAKTGERVWHYQTVHHDLWDYDLPCAPNLVDTVVDGKPIKAVAQMGKTGFCYVLDRATGEPVWPIPEVPVPQTTVPGERTAATQPMPTRPAPFSVQGLSEDNLINFTPEIRAEAMKIVGEFGFSPIFTPPSETGVWMIPGEAGGANWNGAAVDVETSMIYVPSGSYGRFLKVVKPDSARSDMDYIIQGGHIMGQPGPFGLPLINQPNSRVTAIDLKTGEHAWMTVMGDSTNRHPKLRDLDIPPMGDGGPGFAPMTFPLTTKTLLIIARVDTLLAMDKTTGEIIAEVKLQDPDGGSLGRVSGAPMTYLHDGKQYIVVALTGPRTSARLVALSL